MNSKRTSLPWVLAGVCAALALVRPAPAAEDAGKKKADAVCAACHGPGGAKPNTPDTPRLAGQQYGYLVQSLTEYRKGTRANPLMGAIAKPLTDMEIRDLAAYFSTQPWLAQP